MPFRQNRTPENQMHIGNALQCQNRDADWIECHPEQVSFMRPSENEQSSNINGIVKQQQQPSRKRSGREMGKQPAEQTRQENQPEEEQAAFCLPEHQKQNACSEQNGLLPTLRNTVIEE